MDIVMCEINVNINEMRGKSRDIEISDISVECDDGDDSGENITVSFDIDVEEIIDNYGDEYIKHHRLSPQHIVSFFDNIIRESDIFMIKNNLTKHHKELLKRLAE